LIGIIPELEKGDVLGHECCGIVETTGPEATKFKVGDHVVVSFPIACGDCRNCRHERFSQCERTNENTIANAMYGKRTAGMSIGISILPLINFTELVLTPV
jgi:threonine dehydrogenase-like Zn-dependent dehydrogenase